MNNTITPEQITRNHVINHFNAILTTIEKNDIPELIKMLEKKLNDKTKIKCCKCNKIKTVTCDRWYEFNNIHTCDVCLS